MSFLLLRGSHQRLVDEALFHGQRSLLPLLTENEMSPAVPSREKKTLAPDVTSLSGGREDLRVRPTGADLDRGFAWTEARHLSLTPRVSNLLAYCAEQNGR